MTNWYRFAGFHNKARAVEMWENYCAEGEISECQPAKIEHHNGRYWIMLLG